MKRIVINSPKSESEVLLALKDVASYLASKGLISKTDEIVTDVDLEGDGTKIVLNGDILVPSKLGAVADKLSKLGAIINSDKEFDGDSPEPKNPEELVSIDNPNIADGNDQYEKDKTVMTQSVAPALSLHDTNNLLFNIKTKTNMNDLLFSNEEVELTQSVVVSDLLFSDDEINKSFKDLYFDDVTTSDSLYFDTTNDSSDDLYFDVVRIEDLYFDDLDSDDADTKSNEIRKVIKDLKAEKSDITAENIAKQCGCSVEDVEKALKTFDDLYFDEEALKQDLIPGGASAPEPAIKDPKNDLAEAGKEVSKEDAKESLRKLIEKKNAGVELTAPEKLFCNSMRTFDDEEVKELVEKVVMKDDATLLEKEVAKESLEKLIDKKKAGVELTAPEKLFCNQMKTFGDEEIESLAEVVDPKSDVLVEKQKDVIDHKPAAPALPETKMSLVRTLNKKNVANDLASLAKEQNKMMN